MKKLHEDEAIITALGGPAEVARMLGLSPSEGGVQRVYNWTTRGIPVALRWTRQDVFGDPPVEKVA